AGRTAAAPGKQNDGENASAQKEDAADDAEGNADLGSCAHAAFAARPVVVAVAVASRLTPVVIIVVLIGRRLTAAALAGTGCRTPTRRHTGFPAVFVAVQLPGGAGPHPLGHAFLPYQIGGPELAGGGQLFQLGLRNRVHRLAFTGVIPQLGHGSVSLF